ncbi:thiamine phosphate synthase [Pelotomaculum propionicicum]|uniref:Thiamine-phosphate synthase n=1 Tax=Pelotomaculum propionicicum TaxID=258475 RepID=A0A4Y7RLT0_9FIRM|nr:thiamine phosphate synthase [Pelotomaculum propionicicum]NLI12652.1 thiamine phosphate synthase [Peptococcaceae bacterium]TEB09771.1 Thiamine-phosphate synthase [Pelotomaculum propionicicum]
MPVDYSLYLVTDRGILKGRSLFAAVEEAIRGGVSLLQLREKNVCSRDFYHIALELKELANSCNVPLIINDRLDIALAVDADGLHVGQEDLPLEVARKLLGPDKILGYSVSNTAEAAYGEKNGADYLGAGPVYPTGSKLDTVDPIGVEVIKTIKESVSIPVVAIGGISRSNAAEVKKSGVDGLSVISAILGSPQVEENARCLKNIWRA